MRQPLRIGKHTVKSKYIHILQKYADISESLLKPMTDVVPTGKQHHTSCLNKVERTNL